jgi:class 3 adenylate cyclase
VDAEPSGGRALEEVMEVELPPDVWNGREYTNIYCAVLFADLENSVQISRIISPADYDELIDQFQAAMLRAVGEITGEMGLTPGEVAVAGDQLALFFYDTDSVKRNYLLDGEPGLQGAERKQVIDAYRKSNEGLAFDALKAAVHLKNSWLVDPVNLERVIQHREPYGLALGVHIGKVFLRERSDGRRRVEGFTVNMAKRVESYSRQGKFSRIMFSQAACNLIRGSVRGHSQLRQRIFFHKHAVDAEALKGIGRTELYELKFLHSIRILPPTPKLIQQYEKVFAIDETNVWAYYQLTNYYGTGFKDLEKVLRLAQRAYLVYPDDEKVLMDLAYYHQNTGNLEQAKEFCLKAISANPELDLAYEELAFIYDLQGIRDKQVEIMRKAVMLSPESSMNRVNLGMALCENDEYEEAVGHLAFGIRGAPSAMGDNRLQRFLSIMSQKGLVTEKLRESVLSVDKKYEYLFEPVYDEAGQPVLPVPALPVKHH